MDISSSIMNLLSMFSVDWMKSSGETSMYIRAASGIALISPWLRFVQTRQQESEWRYRLCSRGFIGEHFCARFTWPRFAFVSYAYRVHSCVNIINSFRFKSWPPETLIMNLHKIKNSDKFHNNSAFERSTIL